MNCVSYAKFLFYEQCIILPVCFSVVNVLIASSLKKVWNIIRYKIKCLEWLLNIGNQFLHLKMSSWSFVEAVVQERRSECIVMYRVIVI